MEWILFYILTGVFCVFVIIFIICSCILCGKIDRNIEDLELENFIRQREELSEDGYDR